MTREELVKELNKIDGIRVGSNWLDDIHIVLKQLELYYDFDRMSLSILQAHMLISVSNRTPKQFLSVVKALVG